MLLLITKQQLDEGYYVMRDEHRIEHKEFMLIDKYEKDGNTYYVVFDPTTQEKLKKLKKLKESKGV